MNYKIGKLEALFLILIVMTNKILLNMPKEIIKEAKTGAPANLIFTCIICILLVLLICKLFKKFPNEDIIDISYYLGKKPLQILLSVGFTLLFSIIILTVIYEFTNLLQVIYFPNTPTELILLFFLVAIAVANKVGFRAIIKTNTIVVALILLSLIIILGGTINNLNLNRLNPILGQNINQTFIKGLSNIYAYGGLVYLFFILPFLKDKNKFKSISVIAILISGLFLIFTTITLLSLFPFILNSEELMSMYVLTRCIEFGEFFQRTDAAFIFLWIISAFSYLSVSHLFLSNIFRKTTQCKEANVYQYSFLGIFFGLFVLFKNQVIVKFLETIVYKYLILALLGLSLIILIFANIKRKDC